MKIRDYGKMAATFINLESGKAVRVATTIKKEEGSDTTSDFSRIRDEDLFSINDVEVPLRAEDMPGKHLRRRQCSRCGETALDARDFEVAGQVLCKPCFDGKDYYRILDLNQPGSIPSSCDRSSNGL
jgi:formylmethanofuran dehydrogenase subunit E